MKRLQLKKFRIYRNTAIAFVVICIAIAFACLKYYQQLQATVKSETSGYMQEIAKQMGTNISKTMNDNFSALGTISTVLNSNGINTYDSMKKVISEHKTHWEFQKIMLIDANGVAFDESGKKVMLKNDSYLQNVIVKKEISMSSSQLIDGKDCIIFAIPIENVSVEGVEIVALAGAYDLSTFDQNLSMTAFDGKGYAQIVHNDGTAIVRSSSENAVQTGYNILQSLSTATLSDGVIMEDVLKNIAGGKSGQMEFKQGDNHEYMTYTSLETLDWNLLTFVPVSAVNQKSSLFLNITLFMCTLITLTFALLCALIIYLNYRNRRKLENIAYVDTVTKGNTKGKFEEDIKELISAKNEYKYALIYTNIVKFKVLNEQFGRATCDEMLKCIYAGMAKNIGGNESIGRLYADHICALVKYDDEKEIIDRFSIWQTNWTDLIIESKIPCVPPTVEIGIYTIINKTVLFENMIDRAKLSLSDDNKESLGKIRYAVFNEHVRNVLFREKYLEDMMEKALKNKEFVVYLQPKYKTQTEEIGGAEALVRWKSKIEGMIYPDEFIPLFEKNGFIVHLDMYVFEEVCKTIRNWIDANITPIKISVNCSRVHFKNSKFLEQYKDIATKYRIPDNIIEIELTESTVFENVENLTNSINKIHQAGFGCSMDDFGSGYSSLNLIQDIPVDTLKLDKIFFRTSSCDIKRTESVVGSIITMSKALAMETVAEGVEEQAQVDMLKRLSCDYIQGYFFAKPMPIDEFEKIAFKNLIKNEEN